MNDQIMSCTAALPVKRLHTIVDLDRLSELNR